jgi:hypothetical protein
VTSAALILFLSFTSMASGPETDVKMMATGLAAGILLERDGDPGADRPRGHHADGAVELAAAGVAGAAAARPALPAGRTPCRARARARAGVSAANGAGTTPVGVRSGRGAIPMSSGLRRGLNRHVQQ